MEPERHASMHVPDRMMWLNIRRGLLLIAAHVQNIGIRRGLLLIAKAMEVRYQLRDHEE